MLRPDHCVQDSTGAEFSQRLYTDAIAHVVQKGTEPRFDSYSGFFDIGHRKATGLVDYLRQNGVHELIIVGLAVDYCAKYTVLDVCELGFGVTLAEDGTCGVNLPPADTQRAFVEMAARGGNILPSAAIDPAANSVVADYSLHLLSPLFRFLCL